VLVEIIGLIIAGLVIGALARLVLPGKQSVPLWLHLLVGVVGVQAGYWIAAALGVEETRGIDWIRWIISIVVAVVALILVDRLWASRDLGTRR
jgi:uncharacterized membrane protein YeaQ/YmgE (transglycosylase-associated protein family)